MNSFSAVVSKLDALPINVSWQLEAIAEKRGHQELYTRQSPEQLARLARGVPETRIGVHPRLCHIIKCVVRDGVRWLEMCGEAFA